MSQRSCALIRRVFSVALLAIVMGLTTGCMTTTLAGNRAMGYDSFPPRDPKQQDHPQPRLKPNPAYYAFFPLTLPFDIATLPIQIAIEESMGGKGPFILNEANQL